MKFFSIFIFLVVTLLEMNTVISGPPQRLIIQFDTPINAEQQQALNLQIKSIIKVHVTVLPQSVDQRWILVVDPALDEAGLKKAINELNKLEHVQYAEPDQILNFFR